MIKATIDILNVNRSGDNCMGNSNLSSMGMDTYNEEPSNLILSNQVQNSTLRYDFFSVLIQLILSRFRQFWLIFGSFTCFLLLIFFILFPNLVIFFTSGYSLEPALIFSSSSCLFCLDLYSISYSYLFLYYLFYSASLMIFSLSYAYFCLLCLIISEHRTLCWKSRSITLFLMLLRSCSSSSAFSEYLSTYLVI